MRAALYARYSTDMQSEASVEDQFRVCVRVAEREGFRVVARFEDRGISGGTSARPGYQDMLEAARNREFDAVLAEDLKRLWREQAEQWRCIKEWIDLGICVVTASGIDSRQQNFEVIASVVGAAAELDRKEAAYRTRRGLEGRAAAGKSTGGRAYGYVAARDSRTGQIEIDEREAGVVRRIFTMYADGASPRTIASQLNEEEIPSPGASWRRKATGPNSKRRRKWVASAIHGDVRRGSGILNNERYLGSLIFGRSQWKRGAADSAKRIVSIVEDRAQWIVNDEQRLRIVPQELWDSVKARQRAVARGAGGIQAARTGRKAVALLSGLLVCESCGARFIAVDRAYYGCASLKQGGLAACRNTARVKRERVEALLLAEIEEEILSDEAIEHAQKAIRAELRRLATREEEVPRAPRLEKLESDEDELRRLQKTAKLSATVVQAALEAIERERAELVSSASRAKGKASAEILRMIPQSARLYREAVRNLMATLTEPAERQHARVLIADLLGGQVKVRQEGDAVYARLELDAGRLLAVGASASKINDFKCGSGGRTRTYLGIGDGIP